MRAAYVSSVHPTDPLAGLVIGDRPDPDIPAGWLRVTVKAVTLNHHDVWSLRGVGLPAERLPMILGCDGAGTLDDGTEVVIHSVVSSPSWRGDETLDPHRSLLSEVHQGTLATHVVVPARNAIPKPAGIGWEHAAALPTAWLTAYRMLFTQAQARPGQLVLVQGAGGGVATALIQLGAAAGLRMWVTSRDPQRAERALDLGAERVFASGARLPEKVDAVMETVGAATWSHSVNVLRPGGCIVISGATSGDAPAKAELTKIFFRQLRILGSTMGTVDELRHLLAFVDAHQLRPLIDTTLGLDDVGAGLQRLIDGTVFGKVAVRIAD